MADSHEYSETHAPFTRPVEAGKETQDHLPAGQSTPRADGAPPNSLLTEPMTGASPPAASADSSETLPPTPDDLANPPTGPEISRGHGSTATGTGLPIIPGFEVLAEVGRGGMGVVYRARQLDLNRLVAIKMVVEERFGRPEELVRFRLEAEMVARVRHPNVVQVYDSGACAGCPYLVLEWIEGGTLGHYLKQGPQPPEVGARTVELLARAIHVAHCNGVVHRDLKPSNVLVAHGGESLSGSFPAASGPGSTVNRLDTLNVTLSIDGRPVPLMPKIADFGIAKQLVGATRLTETGKILGTPEYMAPEQAEGRSDLTGPATDVYALGVILYQMLTGRTPFRGETGVALLKRVMEEEPRRPRALDPRVPRDLETICLKCLEKLPLRRYQTAETLAGDLSAFLEGRPITARPTGPAERAWKWAQRRPAVAALATAAAMFFVLGFAGVTWQWRAAVAQRDRAVKAEGVSDAVNHFLIDDLLATAAPEKSLGRKITVEEVLQNASARIDGSFANQPEVAAGVRVALGNSYRKLGLFEAADRHLAAGLDLRRKTFGDAHRDTLAAAADRGLLLADERKWDEAIPLLRMVVADAGTKLGPDDSLTIEATGRLALVLQEWGKTAEAEGLFKDALDRGRRVLGPVDPLTLSVLNDYGMLLQARKKLPEAEAAFREAADGRAKTLAPAHPATLESRQNLAVVLDDEGRWTEAKPLYEQVLKDKRRVLGRNHVDTLSTTNNLAELIERHGDPDAALPLFEEAYEGFRDALGADNPVTLRVQNNLGNFYFRLGQRSRRQDLMAKAETKLAAVLEVRRRVLPVNHPDTLQSANDFGTLLTVLNRLKDAEPLLREALVGRRSTFGAGHPDTLITEAVNVQLLVRAKRGSEAITECNEALAAAGKEGNAEHPQAIVLLCLLVETLIKERRSVDALEPAQRAVVLTRKVPGETGEEFWRARRNLGTVLLATGRPADAEPHLRAVYDAYRTVGPTDPRTLQTAGRLGDCLLALKRYGEAEPLLVETLDALRGSPGAPKPAVQAAGQQVIELYEAWDKPEKAAEWREKLK